MAWQNAPVDMRWDESCVIYLGEINKGLRPREWEKKLVELFDPSYGLSPPCASERHVTVDIAGRKLFSAVRLGGGGRGGEDRPKVVARVGDVVTHLAVRNGGSAGLLALLLGRCRVDSRTENGAGETSLDVAIALGRDDVADAIRGFLASARLDPEPHDGVGSPSRKAPAFFAGSREAHHPGGGGGRPASSSSKLRPASPAALESITGKTAGLGYLQTPLPRSNRSRFP